MSVTISGAKAVTASQRTPDQFGPSELPFFLDNVGCNGSETNLLDCLPHHNCGAGGPGSENAGVQCLRKGLNNNITMIIITSYQESAHYILGVKLEHGPNQETNNTLITMDSIGEGESTLFCSTDREHCCTDSLSTDEGWFLPNGSKVSVDDTQSPFMTLGNQTVGLAFNASDDIELPTGIYHCEMRDKENVSFIQYLYVGIYPKNEGTSYYYFWRLLHNDMHTASQS